MKNFFKYFLLLTFSGYVYVCMELLYRGYSDITMMFCASICVIPMIFLNNIFTYELDMSIQILLSTISATSIEWIFGRLFNQDFSIWDYRNMPLHSPDGQICLPFMLLWGLLACFVIPLMDYIDYKLFNYRSDTPPYYLLFKKKIFQFKE